jgi:hypothetical protein
VPWRAGTVLLLRRCTRALEALDAHLAIKADLGQMREAVCVLRIGLVRSHVERGFGMAGINADRRQAFQQQRMIEPDRQRSRLTCSPEM